MLPPHGLPSVGLEPFAPLVFRRRSRDTWKLRLQTPSVGDSSMRRFVVVGLIALTVQHVSLAQQPRAKEDGVLPVGADGKPPSSLARGCWAKLTCCTVNAI